LKKNRDNRGRRPSFDEAPTAVAPDLDALVDSLAQNQPELPTMQFSAGTVQESLPPAPPPAVPLGTVQEGGGAASPPEAIESALQPGERIRHFEIIKELGRGGMGQVFLARDLKLGRRVAIKMLSTRSAAVTEKLLTEARATVRCGHENIVVLHEVGEHGGQPYIVLEYLEGCSLDKLMVQGPIPQRRALDLLIPVARALKRAHQLQIVHRDLKPGNIFVTDSGTVKVLDFGIARAFEHADAGPSFATPTEVGDLKNSRNDQVAGTPAYMAPEQWGLGSIDTRTDLWALGVIFWEMLTGYHPLAHCGATGLMAEVLDDATPMPAIGAVLPHLHPEMASVIDRCLAKDKEARFQTVDELLEMLEGIRHQRSNRGAAESPYPGLSAYQETDADRFFGRSNDISAIMTRLRSTPLMAVVGPSGVGKSSLIRAGIVPALRAADESWEVITIRPGRRPLSTLASLVDSQALTSTRSDEFVAGDTVRHLREEPGRFGHRLRSWAQRLNAKVLLFVDQFEELYTLVEDEEERQVFAECLGGAADDPSSPVRVVLSMRADFLDRTTENRRFLHQVTQGLYLLPPPDSDGLKEALIAPLEAAGYSFESPHIAARMLDDLADVDGALPLLQFAAGKLWEQRDTQRRILTAEAYQAIGGVCGALALHADHVIQQLPASLAPLARKAILRMVTADGTREIVDLADLELLSSEPAQVRTLIDVLASERLVVVRSDAASASPVVELVHESLIASWPALRRWREESQEDSYFLEQLRMAAKQWDSRGRPKGLLWRGETATDARRFQKRSSEDLTERERDFLDAVLKLATQSARRRRRIVAAIMLVLLAVATGAGIAFLQIREAEREAVLQSDKAKTEAQKAGAALEKMRQEERQRLAAESAASAAKAKVEVGEKQLAETNSKLRDTLKVVESEKQRAQEEAARANRLAQEARRAQHAVENLLAAERKRLKKQQRQNAELQRKLKKLGTVLR
jgi:serine/threonine protein kinase